MPRLTRRPLRALAAGVSITVAACAATQGGSGGMSCGCSQEALRGTGGDGLLYCFAAN